MHPRQVWSTYRTTLIVIFRAPVLEVFRHHWRLLVAGGAWMGVGVVFALAVVFSLTDVTNTLHLSRTLVLVAVMIGTCATR